MKKYIILVLIALLIGALFVGVAAEKKSVVAFLDLVMKNPADWDEIIPGACGTMQYKTTGPEFKFVFNGKGLEAGEDYTLIYYPDGWPGDGLICLGSDTASNNGNVHISGSVDTGDLPAAGDDNFGSGAKIWLVLSDDVDCDGKEMIGWTPEKYLFENNLITFDAE